MGSCGEGFWLWPRPFGDSGGTEAEFSKRLRVSSGQIHPRFAETMPNGIDCLTMDTKVGR